MSDSVRPHRRQPTRLCCPWDFPGKNTGVGCHILLQCMKVKRESEVAQSCPTLRDPMDGSPSSSSVHGILQARVLEWGATEPPRKSKGSSQKSWSSSWCLCFSHAPQHPLASPVGSPFNLYPESDPLSQLPSLLTHMAPPSAPPAPGQESSCLSAWCGSPIIP